MPEQKDLSKINSHPEALGENDGDKERNISIFKSKFLWIFVAISFLIAFLLGGFFLSNKNSNQQIACTQEAKMCPDGTSVGRTGPNCEFSPCPTEPTADWKTFNGKGFSIKYPSDWVTVKNEFISETTFIPGEQKSDQIYNIVEIHKYSGQIYSGYTNKQWFEKISNLDKPLTDEKNVYGKLVAGKVLSGEPYVIFSNFPSTTFVGSPADFFEAYVLKNQTIYQFSLYQYDENGSEVFRKMLPTFKFTESGTGVSGKIILSSTCGGPAQSGENCTKPYKATVIVKNKTTGKEVTRFTSDTNGNFSVKLDPGIYILEPVNKPNDIYPVGKPQEVKVTQGKMTDVTIIYETGML